jgi:hypothetical protein
MSGFLAPVVGALLGVLTGWICERVPVPGIIQTMGGGFVAFVSSAIAAAILWFLLPPAPVQIKAVFFGASAIAFPLGALVASAILHLVLGNLGRSLASPWLVIHRPIVVALLAGVLGALSFAAGRGPAIPMGR